MGFFDFLFNWPGDRAISACREAIRINPKFVDAHYNLALILYAQGQLDNAISAYREAIRINPKFAEAYCRLGCALGEKGQFDDAISACREAIRINPKLAEAYLNLGKAQVAKGQMDDAVESYENFIKYAPPQRASHAQNLKDAIRQDKPKGGRYLKAVGQEKITMGFFSRITGSFKYALLIQALGYEENEPDEALLKHVLPKHPEYVDAILPQGLPVLMSVMAKR